MAYLDKLLAREERVLLESRRHPLFMVLNSGPYVAGTILLWITAVLAWQYVPDVVDVNVGTILGVTLFVVALIPLAIGIYRILHWWRELYVVTSFRIVQVEGLMNRRTFDSALEKVNDVVMTQSIFGRMFDYGTINIITGSDAAINDIAGVSKPFDFKRALMEAKMDFGQRGMNDDGFPQRMKAEQDPDSQSNETNQLPAIESEQQQSRAVIALTELRNSGVISDTEFNEKLRKLTGAG